MIEIRSNRLRVWMFEPGKGYSGSRFDWNGFITGITLDGKYTFCSEESLEPGKGSGGRGLCNEFGIHEAVGYDEAGIGEDFPKFGIGLIERTGPEEYNFFKPYPIRPFETEISVAGSSALFLVRPMECNGYTAVYQKEISVDGNRLAISYKFGNIGAKPIKTTEYCHNFVNLNGKAVGPDYELEFPFQPAGGTMPEVFKAIGCKIGWLTDAPNEFYWAPGGYNAGTSGFHWELRDAANGIGMREDCLFPVERVAIWGKAHVVSPEMFVRINLDPGEEMSWKRVYTFYA